MGDLCEGDFGDVLVVGVVLVIGLKKMLLLLGFFGDILLKFWLWIFFMGMYFGELFWGLLFW